MSLGSKQKTSTTIPQWRIDAGMDAVKGAEDLKASYKPFEGPRNAGIGTGLQNYWDMATQYVMGGGAGGDNLRAGADAARAATGYQPINVQGVRAGPAGQARFVQAGPAAQGQVALIDRNNIAQAQGASRGQVRDVGLDPFARFTADDIRALYNPFENDVVSAWQDDSERSRTIARNADNAAAGRARAFGNGRHAVREAITNEASERATNAGLADIRTRGWESAMGGALTARGQDVTARGQDLQGQIANQQADQFIVGENGLTNRQNATMLNEGLFRNQDAQNDMTRFNVGETNDRSEFDAGLLSELERFNVSEGNDFLQSDADREQQARLANQDADIAGAGLRLDGGRLLGDIGGMQFDQGVTLMDMLGDIGGQQQQLAQDDLDRNYGMWRDEFGNLVTLQELISQATGALPTPTNTVTSGKPGLLEIIGTLSDAAGTVMKKAATGGAG